MLSSRVCGIGLIVCAVLAHCGDVAAAPDASRDATAQPRTAADSSRDVAAPSQPKQAEDRVTSHVLFERGRQLFVAGKYAEACPLFEESHRLSPGVGVLLHLGACLEKAGQTAGAWAAFQEAADRAKADRDPKREALARARGNALQGKLAYLTLRVRDASGTAVDATMAGTLGLELRRNSTKVPNVALGLEIPVDPGEHRVVLHAQGHTEVERRVTVGVAEHAQLEIEVGASTTQPSPAPASTLSGSRGASASGNGTELAGVAPQASQAIAASRDASTTRHALPMRDTHARNGATSERPSLSRGTSGTNPYALWTTVGIGAVGLVTGGVAGLVAYTKMREARALCEGYSTNDCPESATSRQEEARFPAKVSTIAVGVGVASLAFAGGYWLLSRRSQTAVTGNIQPGIALISVQSRW